MIARARAVVLGLVVAVAGISALSGGAGSAWAANDQQGNTQASPDQAAKDKAEADARHAKALTDIAALPADLRGECAWVGTRIVLSLARDDVDQARKFTDFYRLFGCRESKLATAFRCLIKADEASVKKDPSLEADVCWSSR